MATSILCAVAAICSLTAALLTYLENGRPLIICMQIVAGVIAVYAAFKFRSRP